MKEKFTKYRDKVVAEYKKGNVVILTHEGVTTLKIQDLINQPADGILYDLNRNEEVILTFIEDIKWVNDYATAKVIRYLKKQIEEYESRRDIMHTENDLDVPF